MNCFCYSLMKCQITNQQETLFPQRARVMLVYKSYVLDFCILSSSTSINYQAQIDILKNQYFEKLILSEVLVLV